MNAEEDDEPSEEDKTRYTDLIQRKLDRQGLDILAKR